MKVFKKVIGTVYTTLERIGGVLLLCMMLITVLNILLRALFNTPIFGAFEIVCYLSLVMGTLAMPGVEYSNSNISVSIIPESLPKKARRVLKVITEMIALLGCGVVVYKLIEMVQTKYQHGDVTLDLGVPIYIYVAVIVLGFTLTTICLLFKVLYFFFEKKSFSEEDDAAGQDGIGTQI
jgi:TRAP-type C4-dicarboxylate transport system permease small subunit